MTLYSADGDVRHQTHKDGEWLRALRRVMDVRPRLHVHLEKSGCVFRRGERTLVAENAVIAPHFSEARCEVKLALKAHCA